MVDQASFRLFAKDKHKFFNKVTTIEQAKERALNEKHNYAFIAPNLMLIEEEFNQLFTRLQEKDVDREIFWFYCYYCCLMLQTYYHAYEQYGKAKEFEEKAQLIEAHCRGEEPPAQPIDDDSFIKHLGKSIVAGLKDLLTTPFHVAKSKEKIGFANILRIYWVFCRLTITQFLLFAQELKWIDKIGALLGKEIDVKDIVSNLGIFGSIFRGLSVAYFVGRLILNLGMIIKHVYLPSEGEKDLNKSERMFLELRKRRGQLINDVFWAHTNLFTNYNDLFLIPASVAGWVVAGGLCFDFAVILLLRVLAQRDYETKRAQYRTDIDKLRNLLTRELEFDKRKETEEFLALTIDQMELLDISWQAKDSAFWFNAVAALLLAAGFSASMILTPPVAILGCYALCMFAVAMYLSADSYGNYREKSHLLDRAKIHDKGVDKAMEEYQAARNEFILTMIKKVVLPTLFITTFAICWQAALVLVALYIGYELWNAYSKHASKPKSEVIEIGGEQIIIQEGEDNKRGTSIEDDYSLYKQGSVFAL